MKIALVILIVVALWNIYVFWRTVRRDALASLPEMEKDMPKVDRLIGIHGANGRAKRVEIHRERQ
jgi:hypothetical protein